MGDERDWRTASFCASTECVQVAEADWRKSSRSVGGGACVEASSRKPGVAVRDSALPGSPELVFSGPAWQRFAASLRSA
jgi:Domain of unknown function (DUF397)